MTLPEPRRRSSCGSLPTFVVLASSVFIPMASWCGAQKTVPKTQQSAVQQSAVQQSAAQQSAAQQSAAQQSPTQLPTSVVLGGIGTGCIKVSSDGSIGQATINNNRLRPTGDLPGCFGAVSVHSGNQSASRVIALHSAYGLPTAKSIDFDGAFPQATLHAAAGSFPDADVTLRAFSPFIPGDIRNSSIPAAAFVFHIVNRSGFSHKRGRSALVGKHSWYRANAGWRSVR